MQALVLEAHNQLAVKKVPTRGRTTISWSNYESDGGAGSVLRHHCAESPDYTNIGPLKGGHEKEKLTYA